GERRGSRGRWGGDGGYGRRTGPAPAASRAPATISQRGVRLTGQRPRRIGTYGGSGRTGAVTGQCLIRATPAVRSFIVTAPNTRLTIRCRESRKNVWGSASTPQEMVVAAGYGSEPTGEVTPARCTNLRAEAVWSLPSTPMIAVRPPESR